MKKIFKNVLKIAAIALPLVLVAGWFSFWPLLSAMAERRSAAAEVRLTHVGGSVYLIDAELGGRQVGASVAASVGRDGVLLVDSTAAEALAAKVRLALDGLGAGEVRYLINTHPHPDHVRGNAFFARTATVLAHESTRRRMASETRPFRWLPAVPPATADALPSETFIADRSLRFNGEEIRILHFGPGHTDGDAVVHFTGSNVVHVGDLFHGRGGRSVSDVRNAGGDIAGLASALGELAALLPPDVRILCGHGGAGQVSGRGDLETYREMLVAVLGEVEARIAAGRSLEEAVAQGVPERWRPWFEAARDDSVMHGEAAGWLANIYRSLVSRGDVDPATLGSRQTSE